MDAYIAVADLADLLAQTAALGCGGYSEKIDSGRPAYRKPRFWLCLRASQCIFSILCTQLLSPSPENCSEQP